MSKINVRIVNTRSKLIAQHEAHLEDGYGYPKAKEKAEAEAKKHGPLACPSCFWNGVLTVWVKDTL